MVVYLQIRRFSSTGTYSVNAISYKLLHKLLLKLLLFRSIFVLYHSSSTHPASDCDMDQICAAVLSVLCLVISRGTTYSTGAPAEGCWSERPLHRDFLPQGGPNLPYQITTNATSYGPSQTILGERLHVSGWLIMY